jgi:DNA invertase Pin-like site-specific DNA recombinase
MESTTLRDRQITQLAAINIRTSSEHQAEKASPEEQEADCRKLAEEHGLTVVDVYRDIERYRSGKRLVDPSGTRADRPALVAMLRIRKNITSRTHQVGCGFDRG